LNPEGKISISNSFNLTAPTKGGDDSVFRTDFNLAVA
jgi:hypothetical protein